MSQEQPQYEKRTKLVQFVCKPSEAERWQRLWGLADREFSYNLRRVLNAEADRIEPKGRKV